MSDVPDPDAILKVWEGAWIAVEKQYPGHGIEPQLLVWPNRDDDGWFTLAFVEDVAGETTLVGVCAKALGVLAAQRYCPPWVAHAAPVWQSPIGMGIPDPISLAQRAAAGDEDVRERLFVTITTLAGSIQQAYIPPLLERDDEPALALDGRISHTLYAMLSSLHDNL